MTDYHLKGIRDGREVVLMYVPRLESLRLALEVARERLGSGKLERVVIYTLTERVVEEVER